MKKIIFLFSFSLFASFVFSQQKFKTNSISVFKDGTVFLDKTTTVDASSGAFRFTELPFAHHKNNGSQYVLFGTIWIKANNNTIPFMKVSKTDEEQIQELSNINQVFYYNLGKKIKVTSLTKGQTIEGILKMSDDQSFVVQVGNQWHRMLKNDLSSFEFLEEFKTTTSANVPKKILDLEFSKKEKKQSLHLMYLQKGISWSPNYYLEILGQQKAKLSLKANVINDLEDVENVEINFVVGVPAFNFGGIADPFITSTSFQSFLQQLNNRNSGNYANAFSNDDYSVVYSPETYEEQIIMVEGKPKTEGENNEDLFFYKKQNITLEEGSRAMFDILETEFEYEDIYTTTLKPSNANPNTYNQNYSNQQKDNKRNTVWHTLVFENETEFPFTSGSIFFMKKTGKTNAPIGQNRILYTPPTGEANVKMTVAPDIIILDADKEIKRELNVRNVHDDLVTVEGSIDITNYRGQDVQLKIDRIIIGEVLKSDLPWDTVGITTQLNDMNQRNKATWEFELKAGETKKISYTYQVYFR